MTSLLFITALLAGAAPNGGASEAEVRAIWVTRFEYRTEREVRTIVANSAALGFNTILFQVRGQADKSHGPCSAKENLARSTDGYP